MSTSYHRGHLVYYDSEKGWLYSDTNESMDIERPCIRCGKLPTPEGYDACMGHVEGATSVCCGHGVTEPVMMMFNKWRGDLEDDCSLYTEDGYLAHCEAMYPDEGDGDEGWLTIVTQGDTGPPPFNGHYVFHGAEHGFTTRTGKQARLLAEFIIDADRYRNWKSQK